MIDISNPKCDISEYFKDFCKTQEVILLRTPKWCFSRIIVKDWLKCYDSYSKWDDLYKAADELLKLWTRVGWIVDSGHQVHCFKVRKNGQKT